MKFYPNHCILLYFCVEAVNALCTIISEITNHDAIFFSKVVLCTFFSVSTVLIFSLIPVLVPKPRFLRFHGTGSGTSVLVPTSRYQGFGTRFSGGYLHLSHFGTGSVPFRFHFGPKPSGT